MLVGHSLGCVVIEQLVVALDKRAKSSETLERPGEDGRGIFDKLGRMFLLCFTMDRVGAK